MPALGEAGVSVDASFCVWADEETTVTTMGSGVRHHSKYEDLHASHWWDLCACEWNQGQLMDNFDYGCTPEDCGSGY